MRSEVVGVVEAGTCESVRGLSIAVFGEGAFRRQWDSLHGLAWHPGPRGGVAVALRAV